MMYKRKREKKTDYRKRLKYLLSRKKRLVIRKSNAIIYTQIIEYHPNGDKTLISATSKELLKIGYKGNLKSTPSAYLTGLLIAKKAKQKEILHIIPDIGFHQAIRGSVVNAVMQGVKDGGLTLKIDESVVPTKDRLHGEHIAKHSQKSKNISEHIEEIKKKIIGQ